MNETALFTIALILSIIVAYLIGSLNFAIIVSKGLKKDDVRKYGSGNAGMTNVLRVFGKGPAALTLLGDFSKGIVAILLSRLLFFLLCGNTDQLIVFEYIVGLFALAGHSYPVFYKFKGGKGVLVSAGVVLLLSPIPVLIAIVVFIIVVAISKIVSLASISACVSAPIASFVLGKIAGDEDVVVKTIMVTVFCAIIIGMHWQNIGRLIKGEENKFGSIKSNKNKEK